MSEVSRSSPYRSTPDAPVTDDERNQLSARINAAFTDGAVDADDYRHRLDLLFAAQRMGDLLPVVDGLPPLSTYANPRFVEASGPGQPGELAPARSGVNLTVVTVAGLAGVALLIAILLIVLL